MNCRVTTNQVKYTHWSDSFEINFDMSNQEEMFKSVNPPEELSKPFEIMYKIGDNNDLGISIAVDTVDIQIINSIPIYAENEDYHLVEDISFNWFPNIHTNEYLHSKVEYTLTCSNNPIQQVKETPSLMLVCQNSHSILPIITITSTPTNCIKHQCVLTETHLKINNESIQIYTSSNKVYLQENIHIGPYTCSNYDRKQSIQNTIFDIGFNSIYRSRFGMYQEMTNYYDYRMSIDTVQLITFIRKINDRFVLTIVQLGANYQKISNLKLDLVVVHNIYKYALPQGPDTVIDKYKWYCISHYKSRSIGLIENPLFEKQ